MLSTLFAVLAVIVGIEVLAFAVGFLADVLWEVLPAKHRPLISKVGDVAREACLWVAVPLILVLLALVITSISILVPVLL